MESGCKCTTRAIGNKQILDTLYTSQHPYSHNISSHRVKEVFRDNILYTFFVGSSTLGLLHQHRNCIYFQIGQFVDVLRKNWKLQRQYLQCRDSSPSFSLLLTYSQNKNDSLSHSPKKSSPRILYHHVASHSSSCRKTSPCTPELQFFSRASPGKTTTTCHWMLHCRFHHSHRSYNATRLQKQDNDVDVMHFLSPNFRLYRVCHVLRHVAT